MTTLPDLLHQLVEKKLAIERYRLEHPEAGELIVLVDLYLSACNDFYNEVLKTPSSYPLSPSSPAYGPYTTYQTGTGSVTISDQEKKDNAL